MESRIQHSLRGILIEHRKRYPEISCIDIYKLVYQAANGPAHLVKDPAAEQWFFAEYSRILPSEIPIFERIDPRNRLVRLNLKKTKALDVPPEVIWPHVQQTAEKYIPNPDLFKEYWEFSVSWMNSVSGFSKLEVLLDSLKETGYVALHHSEIFALEYKPSYRVTTKTAISEILKDIH